MEIAIDHLVIGAANLTEGVAYIKDCLGVEIPYGGVHPKMGTHNHLMQLGKNIFLEVIAINPEIEPPRHPRWYGLDDPYVIQQIKKRPALLTWVVNTTNIQTLLQKAKVSFGKAEQLISRGDLSWYFGLPDDGRLLAGGMLPYIIEWQTNLHPANSMADLGCRFQSLEIYHSAPSWLLSVLQSIDAADLVKTHPLPKNQTSYLIASIATPKGTKKLSTLKC